MQVILNPRAGGFRRSFVDRIRTALPEARITVAQSADLFTQTCIHARDSGEERIVVGGGDGTLHLAFQQLAGKPVALGILPLGKGNDFARACGIPKDFDSALAVLRTGSARAFDLGRLRTQTGQGAYFGCIASAGVDAEAAAAVQRWSGGLRPLGGLIYLMAGATKLLIGRRFEAEIAISTEVGDMQPIFNGRLWLAAGANTPTYGGGLRIQPRAKPDDCWLELMMIANRGRFALLFALPKLYRGTHLSMRGVISGRARSIWISTRTPQKLFADGEPCGESPVEISIVPHSINVIVPAGASR